MNKKILVVGNCNPDGSRIVAMVKSSLSDTRAIEAKTHDEAHLLLKKEKFDLILVNRVGDRDKINGLELIDWIKENKIETPVMLITNFEDKMSESIEHGGVQGFGKQKINDPLTIKLLEKYL